MNWQKCIEAFIAPGTLYLFSQVSILSDFPCLHFLLTPKYAPLQEEWFPYGVSHMTFPAFGTYAHSFPFIQKAFPLLSAYTDTMYTQSPIEILPCICNSH